MLADAVQALVDYRARVSGGGGAGTWALGDLVAAVGGQPVEDRQPGDRRAARSRDAHRVQLGAERVDGRRGSLDDAVLSSSSSSRELEGALGKRQR